jgi:hypothetical protein
MKSKPPIVPDQVPERDTVHELENHVRVLIVLPDLINGYDIGVLKLADRSCLRHDPALVRPVPGRTEVNGLDGNLPVELGVYGEVDDSLGSFSKFLKDVESADPGWQGFGHGR